MKSSATISTSIHYSRPNKRAESKDLTMGVEPTNCVASSLMPDRGPEILAAATAACTTEEGREQCCPRHLIRKEGEEEMWCTDAIEGTRAPRVPS